MSELNGHSVVDDDDDDDDDGELHDVMAALGDYLPVDECARRSSLGKRFIITLAQRGNVRREAAAKGTGWRYNVADCIAYARGHEPEETSLAGKRPDDLATLVAGYKELLTAAIVSVKQAQTHERELFTAFTAPLKTLVDGIQAQVTSLAARADAGDKSRLDFLVATENMLRENRAEQADANRVETNLQMRQQMLADLRKAAPYLWDGIKDTIGGPQVAAAAKLRASLEKEKVAALFSFDFLSDEQKSLLCETFGWDRKELDAMANGTVATEAAEPEASPHDDG